MMITVFQLTLLASFVLFFVPKRLKYPLALGLQILLVMSTSSWALEAFYTTSALRIPLGVSTWSGEIIFYIDKLSAFFILIVNFVCFAGILYAGGYLSPYIQKKRAVTISLHLFSFLWLNASMVMVTAMEDGLAFLLAWELMSLTSFILVIFEGEKETTLKTGINYLLQMHFGFAMIMFGFLMVKDATGLMSFSALDQFFHNNSNVAVFLAFFAGFGIKAGFMPLHTWLPRAHPAAPSHVSGVMSGVMIKMGIYGILRVSSFLVYDMKMIGTIVLIVAMVSGVFGVVFAIMQHDLKRLLAYHSIENIGIIGIGIGLSILGNATGDRTLGFLGMAGALMHSLNHALFKSLLFFSTGNLYYGVHTVNMDRLGGVAKLMRSTSYAFLIGALAISGIPPFNGFISEFLIYKGIVSNFTQSGFSMALAGLAAFVSLVLIGGLCLYCFTKAFGLTFLGTRREQAPAPAKPIPLIMIIPLFMIVAAILIIGMYPSLFLDAILGVLQTFGNIDVKPEAWANLSYAFSQISLVNVIFVLSLGMFAFIRYLHQKKMELRQGPTWGCGYSAGDYKHQYTPTSYADSLLQLASPVVAITRTYVPMGAKEIFPDQHEFHTETGDRIENSTVTRFIGLLVKYLPMAGRAQTGMIHHYLLYPLIFLAVMGLLTFLNYI